MTALVGPDILWVIPLEEIVNDIQPVDSLCSTFHFTPKKLIESLVHEWFRFRLETGPYQLNQIFRFNRKDVLEQVKSCYLRPEDVAVFDHATDSSAGTVDDIETVIDATGHAVFNALSNYIQQLGVPTDALTRVEILGWAYKSLVVRFL